MTTYQKKTHGGDRKSEESSRQFDDLISSKERTAEKLAKEHSVSKATVERAGKFAKEVESTPELKEAIKTGRPGRT